MATLVSVYGPFRVGQKSEASAFNFW